VALTATLYTFDTELADIDRGVYQTLGLRLARQPSETPGAPLSYEERIKKEGGV
jgi:uncharacterized protein YaeQ